jgi:hypothetical protein
MRLPTNSWGFYSRLIAVNSNDQVRIVRANPNRWLVAFQFLTSSGYIYPGRIDQTPQPIGFVPEQVNDRLDFKYWEWGDIVCSEWYCYSPFTNTSLIVFEVVNR